MTDALATLFPEMPAAALDAVRDRFYTVEVGPGDSLVEEGEGDAAILFIVDGTVGIVVGGHEVATAGKGELVGEIGLFGTAQIRLASVVAKTVVVVVVLDRTAWIKLRDAGNPFAGAVERKAVSHMRARVVEALGRLGAQVEGSRRPTPPYLSGVEALARSGVFDGHGDVLTELASHLKGVALADGEMLCTQRTLGNEVFLVVEGRVDVLMDGPNGGMSPVQTLGGGGLVGLSNALGERPWDVSARAHGPVMASKFDAAACSQLMSADGLVGSCFRVGVIRGLSDQLAEAHAAFTQRSLPRAPGD